jgi:type I restriction enzyme M protein
LAARKTGRRKASGAKQGEGSGPLGFEAKLWQAADALRNNMDAAEYKHVVLGLIFLKYVSDAFEERHAQLIAQKSQGADPEDRDEYRSENIFWVPKDARWSALQSHAKQADIGKRIDVAMESVDKMKRLVTQLEEQFAEGAKLDKAIRKNLKELGFMD